MIDMDDFMFDQQVRLSFTNIVHNGIDAKGVTVRSKRKIAEGFFSVEIMCNNGMIRIVALCLDMGGWFALYLQPHETHMLLTLPALKQYTVEHPWIVGA